MGNENCTAVRISPPAQGKAVPWITALHGRPNAWVVHGAHGTRCPAVRSAGLSLRLGLRHFPKLMGLPGIHGLNKEGRHQSGCGRSERQRRSGAGRIGELGMIFARYPPRVAGQRSQESSPES